MVLLVHGSVDGIRQGQGGAAGGVHLLVVVFFQNLYVKVCRCQHLRRLLHHLQKKVDAQRHVGGAEHRRLLCGLGHFLNLLLGKSGGAKNHGHPRLSAVVQQMVYRLRRGEIDDHVRLDRTFLQGREHGIPVFLFRIQINSRRNLQLLIFLCQ